MAIDTDPKRPRVFVVDPHPVTRLGVQALLQQADRTNTFIECSTVDDALAQRGPAPELVIIDSEGRAEPIEALRQRWGAFPIVVFSGRGDLLSVHRAFSAGASGYVLKHSAGDSLVQAVAQALGGCRYTDPTLVPLESVSPSEPAKASQPPSCLSEREDQVLRLIALGLTNREIAERLELSVKTVETYRARTLEKLGLRSRADLVDYAIREGMLAYPQALAG